MNNSYSPSIRFLRNTLVLATAFAILGVMTLPGLASASMPSTTVVTPIAVGVDPTSVAVSPDGSSVWVTNFGSGTVSRIATSDNAVTATITVGTGPYGVAVSPDGSSVWVTNLWDGSVSRINTATNSVTDTIGVGFVIFGVAVSPDGSSVWVTFNIDNTGFGESVSRISTTTNLVTDTITVGAGPRGVAVSPDGSSVWVANFRDVSGNDNDGTGNTVSLINTTTNAVTATITVGAGPRGVAVSPDGSSVWVTNQGDGTVSRINTTTNEVTDVITVGTDPSGIAVSPDGSSVWVANYVDSTVSRIIFPPQPPAKLTATPGDAKATISWAAPTNTGGSPITGYSATASPGGKSCTTTTATSCTIVGLTNGTTYSVSVTATNAVGTSDPSAPVSVTLPIPATLAATGSDLMNPPWLAIALFGLGGGALLVSRRRKTQPHS